MNPTEACQCILQGDIVEVLPRLSLEPLVEVKWMESGRFGFFRVAEHRIAYVFSIDEVFDRLDDYVLNGNELSVRSATWATNSNPTATL